MQGIAPRGGGVCGMVVNARPDVSKSVSGRKPIRDPISFWAGIAAAVFHAPTHQRRSPKTGAEHLRKARLARRVYGACDLTHPHTAFRHEPCGMPHAQVALVFAVTARHRCSF